MQEFDFLDPEWHINWNYKYPDISFLAGEGYVDLLEKKLFLLLIGWGDNSSAGTFNLSIYNDCNSYRDEITKCTYLVFDLDENFNISGGSCDDRWVIEDDGLVFETTTRSWNFTTHHPPLPDAEI
jgi:hypothetical protein